MSADELLAIQMAAVVAGETDAIRLDAVSVVDQDLVLLATRDLPQLRELRLGESQLTTAGLMPLIGIPSLEVLILGNTPLDDAGAEQISALENLRIFNAAETQLTDAGLAYLARLSNLELLRIGSPDITDAGMIPLAEMPNLKQLILVYLVTLPLVLCERCGWWSPLLLAIIALGLFGMEEASVETEDPFGTDDNCLDLEAYSLTIARDSGQLAANFPIRIDANRRHREAASETGAASE